MSEKSASRHVPTTGPERDTLPSVDQQFLRDQLEALLSSGVLRGSDSRTTDADGLGTDAETDDRRTEPSADAQLLRDAIVAAGKSA